MQTTPPGIPPLNLGEDPGHLIKPRRLALIISGLFLLIALLYILVSGHLASQASQSVLDLETIERIKGIIFVVTTSVLLFVLCYVLFRRIARRERELVRYRGALLASERRAAAGLFASSVAHDMNNVLTIVDYATHALSKQKSNRDSEIIDDLRQANSHLKRLSGVLLRASGRNLPESVADFNLAATVREVAELARTHRKVKHCTVTVETPPTLLFCGIPILVQQMVLNLIINAADATDRRGTIAVRLKPTEDGGMITVSDNGPGVPEAERNTIMEPFFTTKADGSGLGLLSVKVCAESHDGTVEIEKSPRLGGASFKVQLKSRRRMMSVPERGAESAHAVPVPSLSTAE
ncbi:MAG: hypothetical protein Kow0074_14860 [Candidatus Zixiibacteriota bacterium]